MITNLEFAAFALAAFVAIYLVGRYVMRPLIELNRLIEGKGNPRHRTRERKPLKTQRTRELQNIVPFHRRRA